MKNKKLLWVITLGFLVIFGFVGYRIVLGALESDSSTERSPDEIEYLQQALTQENLDEEMRQSIEEKLAIEERIATQQALENLATKPLDPSDARPSSIPDPPRVTGIIENPSVPFYSGDVHINNAWQELVNGYYITVYAGSLAEDPTQGIVIIIREYPDFILSDRLFTSEKAGSLRIITVDGLRLLLQTENKQSFYFDVPAVRFVSSLEEIVSTATIGPTITPASLFPESSPYPPPPYP